MSRKKSAKQINTKQLNKLVVESADIRRPNNKREFKQHSQQLQEQRRLKTT